MGASECAEELLDEIFSCVESHKDLVNLACASRLFASMIIPRHTEYRVVKTAWPIPAVWAHLARRPDLTKNIRKVCFVFPDGPEGPAIERVPTSLVTNADETEENQVDKIHVENVCKALALMPQLTTFMWIGCNEGEFAYDERPVVHPSHQPLVLRELTKKISLVHLNISFAMSPSGDEEISMGEEDGDLNMIWVLPNLESLNLGGYDWLLPQNRHILGLFGISIQFIKTLFVPGQLLGEFGCMLYLPALESLSTDTDHLDNATDINTNICRFLQNHPSITNLNWRFPGSINLAPGALPDLKTLVGRRELLDALEESHKDSYKLKIESLRVTMRVEELNALTCLDRQSLSSHDAGAYHSLDAIYRMAELFPSLTELYLPSSHWKQSLDITSEIYTDIVQKFKNIKILSGETLYARLCWDFVDIRKHILKLAALCPTLQQMASPIRPIYDQVRAYEPLKLYITRQKLSGDPEPEGVSSSPVLEPEGTVVTNGERITFQIREIWSGRILWDSAVGTIPDFALNGIRMSPIDLNL